MSKTLIFVIVAAIAYVVCDEKYTTKYDNMDLDQILHTERLLQNYVKCLMDEGPCTPDGAELRRVLIEAMESDCKKCSAKQKDNSNKVIRFMIDEKPEMWKRVKAKYDPEDKYSVKYEKQLTTTPKA